MTPQRWGVVLFFVVFVIAAAAAFSFDADIRDAVKTAQGSHWRDSSEKAFHSMVRKWGDWPWLMVFAAVCLAVARLCRSRRWTRLLVAAMLASTLSGIAVNTSRLTTGRTRPRASPEVAQGFYGPWHDGKLLIGNAKYNSFPSGHTATAFGFAWPLVYGCPPAGLLALAGAALIGWSSLMLEAHHLSDVVVSIFVSGGISWLVWQWTGRHGETTWNRIVESLRRRLRK